MDDYFAFMRIYIRGVSAYWRGFFDGIFSKSL
jgi:hypothetical protein